MCGLRFRYGKWCTMCTDEHCHRCGSCVLGYHSQGPSRLLNEELSSVSVSSCGGSDMEDVPCESGGNDENPEQEQRLHDALECEDDADVPIRSKTEE